MGLILSYASIVEIDFFGMIIINFLSFKSILIFSIFSPLPVMYLLLFSKKNGQSLPIFLEIFIISLFEYLLLFRCFNKKVALEDPPPNPLPIGIFLCK